MGGSEPGARGSVNKLPCADAEGSEEVSLSAGKPFTTSAGIGGAGTGDAEAGHAGRSDVRSRGDGGSNSGRGGGGGGGADTAVFMDEVVDGEALRLASESFSTFVVTMTFFRPFIDPII